MKQQSHSVTAVTPDIVEQPSLPSQAKPLRLPPDSNTPVHLRILQDSGVTEYYTPPHIIAPARQTMGGIDLDPASCPTANQIVKAARIFAREDNGLTQLWAGRVWLNWPYSREGNKAWVEKLVYEYEQGHITAACCISFASTSEGWFRPLLQLPQCFLFTRTRFLAPNGEIMPAPTKGSVVTYFGKNVAAFAAAFGSLGEIKVTWTPSGV